jgi:hypothetical protein
MTPRTSDTITLDDQIARIMSGLDAPVRNERETARLQPVIQVNPAGQAILGDVRETAMRLRDDVSGSLASHIAFVIMGLIMAFGLLADYASAFMTRTALQQAVDAASDAVSLSLGECRGQDGRIAVFPVIQRAQRIAGEHLADSGVVLEPVVTGIRENDLTSRIVVSAQVTWRGRNLSDRAITVTSHDGPAALPGRQPCDRWAGAPALSRNA